MADPRLITTGSEIPRERYCDQPYLVKAHDGAWVLVMTTGRGVEGEPGQHVISLRSHDHGASWEPAVDVEPATGPEASWAMPLLVPSGRIYCFYTYNTHNQRTVISDDGPIKRVDTFGDLAFRYSDDHGRSWSPDRHLVPLRPFAIDRANPYGGKVLFWWGVGKPILDRGKMWLGFAKVARFGHGFMAASEGAFVGSDNIAHEPDPAKLHFETLPDGEIGLRAPKGPTADEHNPVALSDGSLFCTYRTVDGHPCGAYSRDGGHTWTPPAYLAYEPGGRLVKHPRAANFVKKLANGRFIYWFHNHGGTWYDDRNPAWLLAGREVAGQIVWSQPEILLYDDTPSVRMSYPDFIEDEGRLYFTETQKTVARVHQVEPRLLELALRQHELHAVARDGLVLDLHADACQPGSVAAPKLPDLSTRAGFSLDCWLRLVGFEPGQVIVDGRDAAGKGLWLVTNDRGAVELRLHDGRTTAAWDTDAGVLQPGAWHHVAAIVDGGPKIVSFVVDGQFCDGGEQRQFGWGRFSPHFRDANGATTWAVAPRLHGTLGALRVYNRYLVTSEAVGNWRAGL